MAAGALEEKIAVSRRRLQSAPPVSAAVRIGGRRWPQPGCARGPRQYSIAPAPDFNTERYDHIEEGRLRRVANDPLSTFSIDVDTASYANVRRFLNDGQLPPADAVRIEELINYFRFDYPQPDGDEPFSVTTELAACPWNPKHRLALDRHPGARDRRQRSRRRATSSS